MDVRRSKAVDIARTVKISCGSIETIIHDHLKMSKVSARWVPRNLTADDPACRIITSQEHVDLFTSDPDKFMHQIATGDETWVHHWDPESKQQSTQCRHACNLNFLGGGD